MHVQHLTGDDVYVAGDLIAGAVSVTGRLVVGGTLKVAGGLAAQLVDAYGDIEIDGDAVVEFAARAGGAISIGGVPCLTSPNHPELRKLQ